MGIKTRLCKEDVVAFFDVEVLKISEDGHTDSVYFIDDKYVLKLFEKASVQSIKEEIKLLEMLKDLPTPKIKRDLFYLKEKASLIYTKLEGKSVKKPTLKQVQEIAKFLKTFHTITKGKKSKNEKLFDKKRVHALVKNSQDERLIKAFDSLDLELKNDGIIHGDLFLDNAVFIDERLSGVFDFIDSCEGDFIFELGVVALSWDLDEQAIDVLISTYEAKIELQEFKKYIQYALICYCSFRAAQKRDYEDLIMGLQ